MPTPRLFTWKQPAAILFTVVAAAACGVVSQSRRPLQEHMAFHFGEIAKVRAALIRGDLEAARDPARAIWLQTDHPDLPRGVDSPAHELRRAAHRTAASQTLQEAAQATAEMGAACARCHRAAEGGPGLVPEFPPLGTSATDAMLRHDWGADRMWDGLIGDDDAVWQAGAEALVDAPLVPPGGTDVSTVTALAREVHDLGLEARRTREAPARAGIYGRLITTCSSCHTLLEDGGR